MDEPKPEDYINNQKELSNYPELSSTSEEEMGMLRDRSDLPDRLLKHVNDTFCPDCEEWAMGKRNTCPKCGITRVIYIPDLDTMESIFGPDIDFIEEDG